MITKTDEYLYRVYLQRTDNSGAEAESILFAINRDDAITQATREFGWPRSRTRATCEGL